MMRGDDIATLQARLTEMGFNAGRVDGIFGPLTESAVKEFQKSVGATIDGKCGPATIIALLRLTKTISGGAPTLLRESAAQKNRGPALANKVIVLDPGSGSQEALEDRISQIKVLLSQAESDYEARVLNERIAKLTGGVAVIRVGASTEAELIEKKYRYEDALAATRAAVEEGIVPGGGTTLLRIANKLTNDLSEEDEKIGFDIVKQALKEPIRQIAYNAGLSPDVVVDMVSSKENSLGLDARTGLCVPMIESGIIDPAKVTRSALQNASSIAGLVLTTETLIVEKPVSGEKILVSEGMI
jgi:chaperonin GroEL (HSP60 family)